MINITWPEIAFSDPGVLISTEQSLNPSETEIEWFNLFGERSENGGEDPISEVRMQEPAVLPSHGGR